jgi:TetR/AcrR family transcriptional regulator, transcriptional repressor for nem operon
MTRGKPLSFDRNEVLKRAMEFFWSHGYEATGMTDLLEHMGIQRQSFYNTFGSKEEILFEAIDLYGANLHSMLREAIKQGETPFEKIDCVFEFWSQESQIGCFIGNCVAEFGVTRDRVAETMDRQLMAIRGIFVPLFEEAIRRGDLPADRDPVIAARTMLTYGQGLALMGKTTIDRSELLGMVEIMKRSLKQ